MAGKFVPRGSGREGRTGWAGLHPLPRGPVGWWAVGLLLATALFPLWWGWLEDLVANDVALVGVAAVLVVSAFALGGVALFRAKDRSLLLGVALTLAGVTVLLGVVFAVALFQQGEDPTFESLAAHPDPGLHGTVAYWAESDCVRVRAASGQPYRDVLCPSTEQDVAKAKELGKMIGPELAWRPDGRLEVTMFRMQPPPRPGAEPTYGPGWQTVVDVRTGRVHDVPAADLPSTPSDRTGPTVNPAGERVTWSSDSGHVEVGLVSGGRTRTLLSADGPTSTYGLETAFWAPNWQWVAADDGRILVITTGRRPVTRILDTPSGSGAPFNFAVTGSDLLAPTK
ncbi:hypothetical protein [Nocardioides mesophilus]|uniref:Uncharacterized protein n=1 Tax=Nocardioides mesophilus TaxID=433659 RepID=A0A7G9REW1_9ACTN|nr:hypothetical protein [Nocardioides mesophilus]QNN54136.1 hypothetical protein H9L09_07140 [Nocardioides mesophilus]